MDGRGLRQHPCKGDYFALAPSAPLRFRHLVYPVPGQAGLGVHVTLDLGGRVRFGPDATYCETLDYAVDAAKAEDFAAAASRYLPSLRAEWLTPDQAGIRPKLHPPEESFADFMIRRDRNNARVIQAAGIESPGLTSCLAVGRLVSQIVAEGR